MNPRILFTQWVMDTYPDLARRALDQAEAWRLEQAAAQNNPAALSGLGADGAPATFWSKFADGLTSLGTAYLGYKGQQQVLETNIQRAQMGLPPIDPATGAPTVRTAVSLSPELMARLQGAGSGLMTVALWGGAALIGIMLLKKLKVM